MKFKRNKSIKTNQSCNSGIDMSKVVHLIEESIATSVPVFLLKTVRRLHQRTASKANEKVAYLIHGARSKKYYHIIEKFMAYAEVNKALMCWFH